MEQSELLVQRYELAAKIHNKEFQAPKEDWKFLDEIFNQGLDFSFDHMDHENIEDSETQRKNWKRLVKILKLNPSWNPGTLHEAADLTALRKHMDSNRTITVTDSN